MPCWASRARLISLSVMLGLAFLMLASLVLQAAISGLQDYLATLFPGAAVLSTIINTLVSLTLVALVLAMLSRYVPDVEISHGSPIVPNHYAEFLPGAEPKLARQRRSRDEEDSGARPAAAG